MGGQPGIMAQNENVLVDTSIWIDYFRGNKTTGVLALKKLLDDDAPILICPPVLQEILQGINSDPDYIEIKNILLNFDILQVDPVEAAIGAADLYRNLKKKGITIKRSYDCLIAYYAIYFNISLLHNNKDFNLIAEKSKLLIYE